MRLGRNLGVLCGLAFLFSLSAFVRAEPSVRAVLDPAADVRVARARAEGVDSVIVVLREDAPRKKDGKLSSQFSNVEMPERVLKGRVKGKKSSKGRALPRRLENLHKAKLKKGVDIGEALKELGESPWVEYAEPNWRVQSCAVPNDPLYDTMFPLNNTGQETYEIVSGPSLGWVNGLPDADMDWQEAWTNEANLFPTNEVIVAVIDTGVDYTHLDITNRMWKNTGEIPGDGLDNDGNGYVDDVFGYDFYYDDGDPMDLESEGGSHGTHVAGTIAAEADNHYGIVGVNPHAKIMALKFLGEGGGFTDDAIAAIIYAVDNGAQILNNSWGGGAWQQSLQDAVDYAVTNGVVFVAASGNSDSGSPFYPATYRGVISVNALNWNDEKAGYSNYGWFTDVSAHGSEVVSLKCHDYNDDGLVVSNDFVVYHGTSMACPQTAGALALLYAKYPGLHPYLYERVLEVTCDTEMLTNAVNSEYDGELGAGRINVNRLINEDVDTGFLRVMWDGNTSLAVPGQSYDVLIDAGIWTNDHTDVSIVATNLTDGISLSSWSVDLGAMTGLSTLTIPTDTFVATIDPETENAKEQLSFELRADGVVLAQQTLSISFVNGNALHLLVDDFNGDGTNEIATAYYDYTMLYDHNGDLKWIAESTMGYGNWTYNIASADLTGDGRKEIVTTEHQWLFSSGDPGLFVFDFEGDLLDGFPVILDALDDDNRRGFGEPALVDLDEDGSCEIVCNMEFDDGSSVIRAYDADASILWETELELTETGPPSAADLNGDGFEELIVWNYDWGDFSMPRSRIYILNGDGSEQASWLIGSSYSADQKEMHSPDKAKPSIGDLDGDGDLEIVVYARRGAEECLFAWHHDGTPVAGWPVELPDQRLSIYDTVKLMDADGDGDVEVFLTYDAKGEDAPWLQVLALDGDGSQLPGFPTAQEDAWNDTFMLDDITGDGTPNILLAGERTSYGTNGVYAVDMNGQLVSGFDPYVLTGEGSMSISDMVLTTFGSNDHRHVVMSVSHEVFIVDTSNTCDNLDLAWPMKHQNPRRTGACVTQTGTLFRCSFVGDSLLGISNLTVNFTGYALEFDPANVWYSWDYDNDGTPDHEVFGVSTSSYSFTSTGNYDVSLTVSNTAGDSFTRTRSSYVRVLPPVEANFSAVLTDGEAPVRIRFTDLSQNNPQSWAWDFDNNGTIDSTEQNPEFDYDHTGSYTVTLTVENDFGEWGSSSDTETKSNYIHLPTTASTTTKYVSTNGLHLYPFKNWNEAATNVQQAVDATEDDDTLMFGDGEYLTGGGKRLEFSVDTYQMSSRDGLTITSLNGPEKTIIKGWGHYPPHRGFSVYNNEDVTIEGFTFRDIYGNGGGGIMFDIWTGTPTVKNCHFINNQEYSPINGGSCINVWNEGVLIQDCQFIDNSSRQGAIKIRTSEGYTATVENCEFRGNSGDSYITAAAIMIDGRSADWVFPGAVGEHIIRNCQFTENTGWYSVVYSQPSLTMENCTFADNAVLAAGGAVLRSVNEENAELTGTNQGPWTVRNTLIANNWAESEFSDKPASPMNFTYSCMTSAVAGVGNIQTNDCGLSGIPGNIHLADGSPCIDAGLNRTWMTGALDLPDGDDRIINGTVDIGADEYAIGCYVSATPQAGTSTLHVAFSGSASSFVGSITNYTWNYGDGSPAESGSALTAVSHSYPIEGEYLATLTVQDDEGNSASNGVVITVDDSGPVLEDVFAPSGTSVIVTYDEAVSPITATNLANYAIDTVSISAIEMTAADEVTLTVDPEMIDLATNTLTVSDIRDIYGNLMTGIQTQQFVYIDAFADNSIWIDFGSVATTNTGWNNMLQYNKNLSGAEILDMVNVRGAVTPVDCKLLDSFDQNLDGTGVVVTNVLYPETAQKDAMSHNNGGPVTFRLSDLEPSNKYDLIFFAATHYDDDYSTVYGVGSRMTDSLQAYNNISNTVELLEVEPDENGEMDIDVYKDGDGALIGVLEIRPRLPMIEISTNQLSIAEGTVATLLVRLLDDPVNDSTVTVIRISGDTNVVVSAGDALTFTRDNWGDWQEVQIFAEEDEDSANGTAEIQCTREGYISQYVTVDEIENDVSVLVSSPGVAVPENSGAHFEVLLTAEPSMIVTVDVSWVSGDTDISIVQGDSLLFSSNDWNIGQSVILAAQTDGDALNGSALIHCVAATFGSTATVTAVELDTDHTGFSAYHDMDNDGTRNASDHANVTHGSTHGTVYPLNDFTSGQAQNPGVVFLYDESVTVKTPADPNAAPYGDAYHLFKDIIDAERAFQIDGDETGVITFTNLTRGATYDLVLFMNRDADSSQLTQQF